MAPKTKADPAALPLPDTFEAAMAELETIVARMESGELPLEESLALYQRGVQLKRLAEDKLKAAEARVAVLDGELLQPFDPGTIKPGE